MMLVCQLCIRGFLQGINKVKDTLCTKESKTTTQVSKQVFLEPEEKEILKELVDKGVECEIRALADDSKINVAKYL